MSLTLTHCTPPDAPLYASAFLSTYTLQPRHIVTMGTIPLPRQHEIFTTAFASVIEAQSHPTLNKITHVLKVTDGVTNEIVSYAIWDYLPNGYIFEEDGFANVREVPEGANERLMREFGRMTGRMRGGHVGRRGGHWLLELLGTHPKHERRGAGAMLIKWGFEQADRMQKPCYVDSSSVGYALYKRCGFEEEVGELIVNFDDYGAVGVGRHKWVALLREPQPTKSG